MCQHENAEGTASAAKMGEAVAECKEPKEAKEVSLKRFAHGLLPLALFVVTFVTVMATLLVYIDNTAMGQRQFRQIMRREDELANVAQDDSELVELMAQRVFVSAAQPFPPYSGRQPHRVHPPRPLPVPGQTPSEAFVAQRLNHKRNGVFIELGAYSSVNGGESRTEWLESELGWKGLLVTPDAHDYFRMRARRKASETYTAQACISTSTHPKEVTYQESGFRDEVKIVGFLGSTGEDFSARVKCFPLYTFLLASRHKRVDFLSISGNGCELSAFKYLPHNGKVHISIIEIVGKQPDGLESLLESQGFKVSKRLADSTIYTSHDIPTLKI